MGLFDKLENAIDQRVFKNCDGNQRPQGNGRGQGAAPGRGLWDKRLCPRHRPPDCPGHVGCPAFRTPAPALISIPQYGSPLHLAISLSNKSTIDSLIEYYAADLPRWICQINSPSMETPLHLAAKLGRIEVIDSLYAISALNDTQRDSLGRLPPFKHIFNIHPRSRGL